MSGTWYQGKIFTVEPVPVSSCSRLSIAIVFTFYGVTPRLSGVLVFYITARLR